MSDEEAPAMCCQQVSEPLCHWLAVTVVDGRPYCRHCRPRKGGEPLPLAYAGARLNGKAKSYGGTDAG